jgi:hypothetical protein
MITMGKNDFRLAAILSSGIAAAPSDDGSPRDLLAEIRRAILEDTKVMGRRMSVDEALARYGFYGVEAKEVIATMADQGILVKRATAPEHPRGDAPEPPRGPFFSSGFGPGASGQFDSSAIKQNIQAAVQGIVGEIERSVERSIAGDGRQAQRHRELDRGREERDREREARHGERQDSGGGDGPVPESESPGGGLASYRQALETDLRKRRGGLVGNLTSYLAVNGFLWFINLSQSPSFVWAAIVSAAWGIGVVSSVVAARRAGQKLREADAMPDLDGGQLSDYKKLNRAKDSMAQHGASTLMVPVLLAVINVVTGPSFLWFLIPTAAMAIGYISHLASFYATTPRLERKLLDSLGIKGRWKNIHRQGKARKEEAAGLGPYAALYREAEAAKDAIAAQLKAGSAAGGPLDADLAPTLDQYLTQVRLLAQSANEIDSLVEGIPMADLSKEKAALAAKRDASASAALKAEYGTSIDEIDKQERSWQELKDQREVVRLRLGSSVNQLRQMRLDLARVQASPGLEGTAGVEALRRRSEELSRYLDDLRSGYSESRKDPYAELAEAEQKKLAEAEKAKGQIERPKG